MDVPTIYGEWREEENYDPTRYSYKIRVVNPDGTEVTKAVDRATYEAVREAEMFDRLAKEESRNNTVGAALNPRAASPSEGHE